MVYDGRQDVALTAGSLEDPRAVEPSSHYGSEGRMPWTVGLGQDLPQRATRERWQGGPYSERQLLEKLLQQLELD